MAQYEKGLVTVVIPTYKRSDMITRAIDSVLNQTYKKIELLLVNDNEPGDEFSRQLEERVKKYSSDERFSLVLQDVHINGAVARNVGIKQGKGEYIAFLDDDDWWETEKVEKQVKKLEELSSEWGGVSCRAKHYKGDGSVELHPKFKDGDVLMDILTLVSDFSTGSLLLRREALDQARYFDENLNRHQDIQLLVDFTSKFKLFQLDEFLLCRDVSDAQNRPDGEKLLMHKKKFFESVKPVVDSLTKKQQKCIYSLHKYELGYVFLRNGMYGKGIKYCCAVFSSPKALQLAIKKTLLKIKSALFK